MSEFLAPLNYDRAHDALRRLGGYTAYTPEGAKAALDALMECYPLVFSKTERKTFENGAVLLELRGANVTEPLVFTSHLDVERGVAARESLTARELPMTVPLSRAHGVALLEALEELLRDGYRPGGDLFLALSMDGLSGGAGAKSMAGHLQARSVTPCFVLDFGGYATMDAFRTYLPPSAPLALIGVAEKGLLKGHVMACETEPGWEGKAQARPLDRLLRAGARLSRHPGKATLCEASRKMLLEIGKSAAFPQRMIALRPRLFFPLIRRRWRDRSVMRQFFLSETTLYAMEAPGAAARPAETAALSFRQTVIPGWKNAQAKQRIRFWLHDPALGLQTDVDYEPSRSSSVSGEAWDALETAIEIQFERAVIAPCLCPHTTDSRFYSAISDRIFRFSPFMVTGEEAANGLCTVTDGALQTAVQFFRSMLSV